MKDLTSLTAIVRAVGLLWFIAGLIMLADQVANAGSVEQTTHIAADQLSAQEHGPGQKTD